MFTLRKAAIADCELINELAKEIFPKTYEEILSKEQLEYMFEWMYSIDNLHKQMNEGHQYFIAYKEDKACGYISIQQEENDLFHLQKIYVLPSFQNMHVGSFLFRKAIEYIRSIHPQKCTIELNVNRENKAVEFYERMGMQKIRQGDFHIGNGYYMNDYIMGLTLESATS
ncbi:GNAT family N-acetyltransferase [uncultured Bacteroides sp.]|uniref:GNAT family N-acetyltransferase n=1 Tax=uncultured Bacteroides sp. TaxID=162156 RepID=UPI002AAC0CD9|nr:GNAT family N-acetyltransferase [uncultured Bacteroides sp.]